MHTDLSRRQFARIAASTLAAVPACAQPSASPLTARQIVDRIKANVGVPWRAQTVDTFKSGDPDTPVKGIVATFMADLSLLQKAAASGKNFVISHEPTFWSHLDTTTTLQEDPIYRLKQDFIRKNNMIVWRFHDHLHARKPDAIFAGFTRTLGWQQYEMADSPTGFNLPPRRFADLAREVQTKLKTRSMRVIGDPDMTVSKIGRGSHDLGNHIRNFQRFDVLISGEVREWDTVEYVRDLVLSGQKKGLLLIAHERWEEHGMKECADWLRTFISEMAIEFVPSGEPFWIPGL